MRLLMSCSISGLIWMTSVAQSASYHFDFGPEKSPIFQDFTPVSGAVRYSKEKGYGFLGDGGQDATRNIADDLGRDFVICDGGTFAVDVEPGSYEVWVLLGDYGEGINPPPFWLTPYTISANGQQVVSAKQDGHNFFDDYVFRNYKSDWQPGQSLWDKYMAKFDRAHQFEVAAEGQIKIAFSGPCPVRAVVLYPTAERTAFEKCIAETNAQRKKQFDGAWTYVPFVETNPAPEPSATDRQRGFMLFRRNYMEEVRPESRPRAEEINTPLTLFAARGEYEPVSFCLYPLNDLKQVQVTVDAPILATPKNRTQNPKPKLAFDLRFAKYSEFDDGLGKYHVAENILLSAQPVDLPQGVTRRWWLTFHVPENQPAGDYRGSVTVRAPGRKPSKLPLVV
ncbi:MAG: hypothetical protein HY318_04515, partial [Armatimonadetes bacterium]|nr:hypothetical protein [Armatimonadota bacterium]